MSPTTERAATMGTARIAELPSKPPRASDRTVVGSRVDTDSTTSEDDAALVVLVIPVDKYSAAESGGASAVLNADGVAAVVAILTEGSVVIGTNASAVEISARQISKKLGILCGSMLSL